MPNSQNSEFGLADSSLAKTSMDHASGCDPTFETSTTEEKIVAETTLEEHRESVPDGGYGWVCVLSSFVFHFFAIGIESTWGVYQRYFFDNQIFPGALNSELAWVGSIQATSVSIIGIFAGLLAERIGYKPTSAIGAFVMSLGLILASFSTRVWHLYLTQGLMFGLGSGIAFIPAVTVLSQWFDKRRGLATGIGVSGSGIGGLVLSPLTQVLIDKLGFRWALRITGFMTFGALTVAGVFLKTRSASRSNLLTKPDLGLIRNRVFIILCSVGFFSGFGFYTPSFYVPDYATNNLGASPTEAATAVALISGLSAAGRIILGIFGDRFGHLNSLALCQGMAAVAQMAVWPFVKNLSGLMAFCSLYGLFSGGFVSLYPVVAADIYGVERIASVSGALFSGYIPGTLVAPPLAGLLIDKHTSPSGRANYISAQMFSGSSMALAAIMAFTVKMIRARNVSVAESSTLQRTLRDIFKQV